MESRKLDCEIDRSLSLEKIKSKMKVIEFKIEFITPLLIGGGNTEFDSSGNIPWKLDEGLTGKALRGCWRFWFRAILGGMVENLQVDQLKDCENKIFGSADSKVGPKFKMQIEILNQKKLESFSLGFTSKHVYKDCIEGEYLIKILPLNKYSSNDLEVLLATIWVWGNLGGIGLRSRRGFGSSILHVENNNPFDKLPLQQEFNSHEDLEKHLCLGLEIVQKKFNGWIEQNLFSPSHTLDIKNSDLPHCNHYFILRSLEQIFVGNDGWSDINEAISQVHGCSQNNSLGWIFPKRHHCLSARMASPIIFRFHKINNSFYPIFTYCEPFCYPKRTKNSWILNIDCTYVQTEFPISMTNFVLSKKIKDKNVFVKSLKEGCDE